MNLACEERRLKKMSEHNNVTLKMNLMKREKLKMKIKLQCEVGLELGGS